MYLFLSVSSSTFIVNLFQPVIITYLDSCSIFFNEFVYIHSGPFQFIHHHIEWSLWNANMFSPLLA